MKLLRTNSSNIQFIQLVKLLDADLAVRDGDDHPFYDQFNQLDSIKHVVILKYDEKAISCGAIKEFDGNTMEVKRMFTLEEFRGKGAATQVLIELEKWAKELSYRYCVLETGVKQPEAIALYIKNGYELIPNYGQYEGVTASVCYSKEL